MTINESEIISNFIKQNKNHLPLFYENLTILQQDTETIEVKLIEKDIKNNNFLIFTPLYKPSSSILIGLINE